MRTKILTLLAAVCAPASFALDYTLAGGTETDPLDFTDFGSWSPLPTEVTSSDTLYIDGYAHVGSGVSADNPINSAGRFIFRNGANVTMNGNNSTITSAGGRDNEFAMQNGASSVLNILGSGNTFSFNTPNLSTKIGSAGKLSGSSHIKISSSDVNSRNTLNFNSVNLFISLSTSADSKANTLIEIGDYSTVKVNAAMYLGGSENAVLQSGSARIEMAGKDSVLDSTGKNFTIGNNGNGGMSGGSAGLEIFGNFNEFINNQTLNVGHQVMSGGTAEFVVGGSSNTVTLNNIIVGNAASTGGIARVVIGGDSTKVKLGNITVNNMGLVELSGNSITALDGSGDLTFSVINVNEGGTFRIGGSDKNITFNNNMTIRGTLEIDGSHAITATSSMSVWFYGADSRLSLKASETGFGDISIANFRSMEGTLVLDFSRYVVSDGIDGDLVQIFSFTSPFKSVIEQILTDERYEVLNAELGVEGLHIYNNALFAHVLSTVPEPAAYASVFGALALAFAAYRRRK